MTSSVVDSGAASLATILRFHGIAVEPDQVAQNEAGARFGAASLVRAARRYGLKAHLRKVSVGRLGQLTLPAIISRPDGSFRILASVAEDAVLLHDSVTGRPASVARPTFEAEWDGNVILLARRASLADLGRRFDITWFLQAMHKYRGLLTEVVVASFFIQVFALVTPIFFQVVIDKVLVHRGITTLNVLIFGLVSLSIFESLLTGLRTHVFAHTTNRIDVELGARLFRHLIALPIGYFEARRAGDSVARVRELENIRNFITSSALTLVIDLVFTAVFIAVMFYYSTLLTWIVLASIPVYVGLSIALTPLFRIRLEEKFNRGAENQSFLVETLTGIQTLKAMAVEPQMQRRWEEQLAGYVQASFRVLALGNSGSQIIQLISKLVTAAILYFGAKAVISGDMTVGELVAFNMLAGRVAQPVLRLAQVWQDFHQTRISIDRLGDILNAAPEPRSTTGSAALPKIRGAIRFDHVTFRYRLDGRPALNDVLLDIAPGQVIGIVGPSGSGKSTLTKLVQRLYVPEAGRVLVDGIDIGVVDASWLRRQVGVVLQENVLFNRSIRENITLADSSLPMDKIIAVAELAGAHEFILELPQGYDTIVGERGASLSGGQRQRIAIARALIGDPRILIFDEATSALDYESERIVQANMRRIARGRTVLIIAHRLSTVRRANSPGTANDPFSSYIGAQYQATIEAAINAWSAVSGLTFVEVPDSATTDVRIGWGDFQTATSGVIGYTDFQQTNGAIQQGASVRLEDPMETSLTTDPAGSLVYSGTNTTLYQVALHEIGRAIGLSDNADPNSVMFGTASSSNQTLDQTDIDGAQALYGTPTNPINSTTALAELQQIYVNSSTTQTAANTQLSLSQLIQAMATFAPQQSATAPTVVAAQSNASQQQIAASTGH